MSKHIATASLEAISLRNATAALEDNVRMCHETATESNNTDCTGKFIRALSESV
jgi:hypothetical protein